MSPQSKFEDHERTGRFPLVFVPPSMCSSLLQGETQIWPGSVLSNFQHLLKLGQLKPLTPGRVLRSAVLPAVGEIGLCESVFRRCVSLGYVENQDFFPFPYDWRGDLNLAAASLAEALPKYARIVRSARGLQDGAKVRFLLVGFSLGALVARIAIERYGAQPHVARMLLVGAYDQGLPSSFEVLLRGLHGSGYLPYAYARARADRTTLRLPWQVGMQPLFRALEKTVRMSRPYYQTLPVNPFVFTHQGPLDIVENHDWLRVANPTAAIQYLREGRQLLRSLEGPPTVQTTYVYGTGVDTPEGYYRTTGGRRFDDEIHTRFSNGDGLVLAHKARSADLQAGVRVVFVEAHHEDLFDRQTTLDLIDELGKPPHQLPPQRALSNTLRAYLSALRSGPRGLSGDDVETRKVIALKWAIHHPLESATEHHEWLPEPYLLGALASATPKTPVVIMGDDTIGRSAARAAWYLARTWASNGAEGIGGPLPIHASLRDLPGKLPSEEGMLQVLSAAILRATGATSTTPDATFCGQLRETLKEVRTILLLDHFEVLLQEGGLTDAAEVLLASLDKIGADPAIHSVVLFDNSRRYQVDQRNNAHVFSLKEERRQVRVYTARTKGSAYLVAGLHPEDLIPFESLDKEASIRSFSILCSWLADEKGLLSPASFRVLLRNRDGETENDQKAASTAEKPCELSMLCSDDVAEAHFYFGNEYLGMLRIQESREEEKDREAGALLPRRVILRLYSVARDSGMAAHKLLSELNRDLPIESDLARTLAGYEDPQERLRKTLDELNRLPARQGRLPLAIWLQRAESLARKKHMEAPFAYARDALVQSRARAAAPSGADFSTDAEAVIDRFDLLPFSFMPAALHAGRAVALLEVPIAGRPMEEAANAEQFCTGTAWLLAPDLIMTNHHVVEAWENGTTLLEPPSAADIARRVSFARVWFQFDGEQHKGGKVSVKELVAMDKTLDFAILRLLAPPEGIVPLQIVVREPIPGESINIIQHPYGGPKKVAIRNNLVSSVSGVEVRYFTDTDFGSSGSPLCDDDWRAVGLHRASRLVPSDDKERKTRRFNVGTTMIAIHAHLQSSHPRLWHELFLPSGSVNIVLDDPRGKPMSDRFDQAAIARYKSQAFTEQRLEAERRRAQIRAAFQGGVNTITATAVSLGILRPSESLNEAETLTRVVTDLERIIGTDDLQPISFLHKGSLAARAVARIDVETPDKTDKGTGFLVTSRLLLTNNHVLSKASEAESSTVEFFYEFGVDDKPLKARKFSFRPTECFITNRELDFTVVAVAEETPATGGAQQAIEPVTLVRGKLRENMLVNLIQHPEGHRKQVALRNNRVTATVAPFCHYETDTKPGSSGAPVFDDKWRVVALHHKGVPKTNDAGQVLLRDGTVATTASPEHLIAWVANEGILISAIADHLKGLTDLSETAGALRNEFLARIMEVDT